MNRPLSENYVFIKHFMADNVIYGILFEYITIHKTHNMKLFLYKLFMAASLAAIFSLIAYSCTIGN